MSTPAPRWNRRPETRRDELLDAATSLLQKMPLAQIKVSDITDAAGTAKGTFYTYFKSKEALYRALNERYLDGLTAVRDDAKAAAAGKDWLTQLDDTIAAMIDYMYVNDDLIEVWEREGYNTEYYDIFEIGTNRIISEIAVDLGRQAAGGHITCDDPLATANLIVHAIDGAVSHDMTGRNRNALGPQRMTAAAQAMVRAMLA